MIDAAIALGTALFRIINDTHVPVADNLFLFFTQFGNGWVVVGAIVGVALMLLAVQVTGCWRLGVRKSDYHD